MKFGRIATATLAAGAATVLMLGTAGAASAGTLSQPKHHKPKHITQVPGSVLAKALLQPRQIGSGYKVSGVTTTGKKLSSPRRFFTVAGISCKDFLTSYNDGYGDTADAGSSIDSTNPLDLAGNAPVNVVQDVSQFASNGAAWTFFQQAQAKYNHCPSISFTTNDKVLGPITETVTNQSIVSTTFAGHPAFQVDQTDEFMIQNLGASDADSLNMTFVVIGTNVYEIQWTTAQDLHVPNWMLNTLISNVQKLYKG